MSKLREAADAERKRQDAAHERRPQKRSDGKPVATTSVANSMVNPGLGRILGKGRLVVLVTALLVFAVVAVFGPRVDPDESSRRTKGGQPGMTNQGMVMGITIPVASGLLAWFTLMALRRRSNASERDLLVDGGLPLDLADYERALAESQYRARVVVDIRLERVPSESERDDLMTVLGAHSPELEGRDLTVRSPEFMRAPDHAEAHGWFRRLVVDALRPIHAQLGVSVLRVSFRL